MTSAPLCAGLSGKDRVAAMPVNNIPDPQRARCPTKLIHACFSFSDLREGDRQLTPWRFYGHSCQGEPVQPGLARKETL